MAHAEPGCHGVREVPVGLYGHDCISRGRGIRIQMVYKLIQCFGAHAACVAVLEKQQRMLIRLRYEAVEVGQLMNLGELRMHVRPV